MNQPLNPISIGMNLGLIASNATAGVMYGRSNDSRTLRAAKGVGWGMLGGGGLAAAAMGTDKNGGAVSRFLKGTGLSLGMGFAGAGVGAGVNMLMRRGR